MLPGVTHGATLNPVFEKLHEEFNCHLEYAKPEVLYEMFVFLEVPGRFKTPKVSKKVYAKDLNFQSTGKFQVFCMTNASFTMLTSVSARLYMCNHVDLATIDH